MLISRNEVREFMFPKLTCLQSIYLTDFLKSEPSIRSFLPKFNYYIYFYFYLFSRNYRHSEKKILDNTLFRTNTKLKNK